MTMKKLYKDENYNVSDRLDVFCQKVYNALR